MVSQAQHKRMMYLLAGKTGQGTYEVAALGSSTKKQKFLPIAYLALYLNDHRIEFVNCSANNGLTYRQAVGFLLKSKIKASASPNILPEARKVRKLAVLSSLEQANLPTAFIGFCRGEHDKAVRALLWYPKELPAGEVLGDFQKVARVAK